MELGLPCIGEPPYYLVQRMAARKFFPQKLNPEKAKISLCKIDFFFTKLSIFRLRAKFLKNGGGESRLGARAAVYRGAAVLSGAEEGRRTEGGEEDADLR